VIIKPNAVSSLTPWFLRSPNPSNANNVRNIKADGTLSNNNANNGNGVAPDCGNSLHKVGASRNQHTSYNERSTCP